MFLNEIAEFLKKIGPAFKGIFNAAQRTWNKVSPEIKKALLQGSGIIALINKNLSAVPTFVITLIQSRFPGLNMDTVKNALAEVPKAVNIAIDINSEDLLTLVSKVQQYLAGLKGKLWANISQTLSAGIAAVVAPAESKFAAIGSLLEFVYQTFIKKPVAQEEPIHMYMELAQAA